jgi:pSer/pThr/pTyr-binding forkhead associated (FHA) protein
MAKLILSFENTVLKTVKLDKERLTIGRRPDNDIQVDNLGVSGLHAVITTVLNDSVIEDMNSTNGTLVNGQPITKHMLKDNDVIELGKHKLKFVVEAVVAAPYANLEKTMVIRRPAAGGAPTAATAAPVPKQDYADLNPNTVGLKPATPAAPAAAPVAPAAAAPTPTPSPAAPQVKQPTVPHTPAAAPTAGTQPRPAAVQVLSGSAVGRTVELTKPLTSIGKAGLQVAVITRRPNGYFMTHVEGATFPLLNGTAITKQAQQLNDNDTIEIAGIKMTFFYK